LGDFVAVLTTASILTQTKTTMTSLGNRTYMQFVTSHQCIGNTQGLAELRSL
jgi:hypothetical protein